jgi:hypothetical protein
MNNSQAEKTAPQQPVSKETLAWLLKTILHLPRNWLMASVLFAFVSLFDLSWTKQTGFSFAFRVTTTTVLLIAVIWIPALLQLFALVGGAIKTPAGELSSPGIEQLLQRVDSETKDEAIGALKVVLERAEERAPAEDLPNVRQARQQLDEKYAAPLSVEQARRELNQLADRFQELQQSPSGTRRNFLMEALAGGMRTLVLKAKLSATEINSYLQSEHPGQRLAALSLLKLSGDVRYFEPVLNAIANPKSAFEQVYALRVMEKMLLKLDSNQKKRLEEVLIQQRQFSEAQKQWIKEGSDRWIISERLLSNLKSSSSSGVTQEEYHAN